MKTALLKFSVLGALLLGSLAQSGCGSSGDGSKPTSGILSQYPADSFAATASTSGKLEIAVRTGPTQPPTRGNDSVLLSITNAATGEPVDDLSIEVAVPYMSDMPAEVTPSVAAKGGGLYLLTNVDFAMPGSWQIPLTLTEAGGTADPASLAIAVNP